MPRILPFLIWPAATKTARYSAELDIYLALGSTGQGGADGGYPRPGVGTAKLERYGEKFLAVLRAGG